MRHSSLLRAPHPIPSNIDELDSIRPRNPPRTRHTHHAHIRPSSFPGSHENNQRPPPTILCGARPYSRTTPSVRTHARVSESWRDSLFLSFPCPGGTPRLCRCYSVVCACVTLLLSCFIPHPFLEQQNSFWWLISVKIPGDHRVLFHSHHQRAERMGGIWD